MNTAVGCAWCSPSNNGTDGICDDCMLEFFGVNPATIHAEMTAASTAAPDGNVVAEECEALV